MRIGIDTSPLPQIDASLCCFSCSSRSSRAVRSITELLQYNPPKRPRLFLAPMCFSSARLVTVPRRNPLSVTYDTDSRIVMNNMCIYQHDEYQRTRHSKLGKGLDLLMRRTSFNGVVLNSWICSCSNGTEITSSSPTSVSNTVVPTNGTRSSSRRILVIRDNDGGADAMRA